MLCSQIVSEFGDLDGEFSHAISVLIFLDRKPFSFVRSALVSTGQIPVVSLRSMQCLLKLFNLGFKIFCFCFTFGIPLLQPFGGCQ